MQRTKANRQSKTSADRKGADKGRQRSSIRNGQRRATQSATVAPTGIDHAAVLNGALKPKSFFAFPQHDTDREIDAQILLMHTALKQIPRYKDTKDWPALPTKVELADHLVAEIKRHIPKGFDWQVQEIYGEVALEYGKFIKGIDEFCAVPLEWLVFLKAQNQLLELCASLIIWYIAKTSNIDLIYTEYHDLVLDGDQIMNEEDEELKAKGWSCTLQYKKGWHIHNWKENLGLTANRWSVKEIAALVHKFKPTNEREQIIKEWLILGVEVIQNPVDLDSYILPHDRNYFDGKPLSIKDGLHFCWSFKNYVELEVENWRNDIYSNIGFVDTGLTGGYYSGKALQPSDEMPLKNLVKFMNMGRKIYFDYYEQFINDIYA